MQSRVAPSTCRRSAALALYRDLVHTAKLLAPSSKSQEAISQIRSEFQRNKSVHDESQIDEFLRLGDGKLKFIRMIVPQENRIKLKTRGGRYVVSKEGEVVEGRAWGERRTKWNHDYHTLDPEHLKRHEYLLRRQHFMEPPPAHIMEKFRKGE